NGRLYLIELHKRYAYPAACLVLMLIGIPLGLSSRRGGKSTGFVLTIALVFIYFFFSATGSMLAREGKLPVTVGVWAANLLFGLFGLLLLQRMATGDKVGAFFSAMIARLKPGDLPKPKTAADKEQRHSHER